MNNLVGKLSAVGGLSCTLSAIQGMTGELSSEIFIKMQEKVITPTDEVQEIKADVGYAGLSVVTVNPIPQNYGKITYNGSYILVS